MCLRNRIIAFQRKFPTRRQVQKWVRAQRQHCDVEVLDTRDQNIMLHLPRLIKLRGVQQARKFGKDPPEPIKCYKAVKLARNIHDARDLPVVLEDAIDLACDGDEELHQAVVS